MAFIYVITNQINNKQYVGKTQQSISQRWKRHIYDSERQEYVNRPLYSAFHKYGIENFKIELLEECNDNEASEKEIFWISQLNTFKFGYNATCGGEGQMVNDYEEIYQYWLKGHTYQEVQDKFKITKKSVQKALDTHNISLQERIDHGVKYSEKSKNIGAHGRKKMAIVMCDLNTKESLREFSSKADALRFLGKYITDSSITKVCRGERQSAFGYYWKYKDN